TRLENIRWADDLDLDLAEFHYTPQSLKAMETHLWRFKGLSLSARVRSSGVEIGGFRFPGSKGQGDPSAHSDLPIAYLPQRMVLEKGRILLALDLPGIPKQNLSIPFDARVRIHKEKKEIQLHLSLAPLDQAVEIQAHFNAHGKIQAIQARADNFNLIKLAPLLPRIPVGISGITDIQLHYKPESGGKIQLSNLEIVSPKIDSTIKNAAFDIKPQSEGFALKGKWIQEVPGWSPLPLVCDAFIPGNTKHEHYLNIGLDPTQVAFLRGRRAGFQLALAKPAIRLIARGSREKFQGGLTVSSRSSHLSKSNFNVKTQAVTLKLPFVYPLSRVNKKSGQLRIGGIQVEKSKGPIIPVQNLGMDIGQRLHGKLKLDGTLTTKDKHLPRLTLEGELDPLNSFTGEILVKSSEFTFTPGLVREFFPLPPSPLSGSAKVVASANLSMGPQGLGSKGRLSISHGNLTWEDLDLTARGIQGEIAFNDLFSPGSVPGQVLTMEALEVGQFKITDARTRFTLEDSKTLLLENASFAWCGGLVSTEALRIPSTDGRLLLTLYCDRINLADLLNQMGALTADGEGTVSGRIPVTYDRGKIIFDQGFLFSTPGKGGRVRVENTEALTQGIPMDTPQFAQLDLTREALKDFDYKWARLNLNSSGDTLTAALQLDGKPAHVLPFVYKKELGGFARIQGKGKGSRFQGITLNLNLKLPFNQVMKFGKTMKNLMNP
ncbi:MAG: YdbH domain-containing protein, partial [Desulfobacterales bacterium]|nr:YdbH domain-containing protein [Desulfobacterales bacterium]